MPTSGKYWLDGQEMSRLTPNERALVRTEKLGFVFQSFNLLARTTALQNVIMPLDYSLRRHSAAEARRLAQSSVGPRRAGRPSPSRAVADVRRTAAAGGHRPRLDQPSRAGAGRRADRQPRFAHERRNPADVPATQRRGDHRRPGDARSQGGRLRPSDHSHRRRHDRGRRSVNPHRLENHGRVDPARRHCVSRGTIPARSLRTATATTSRPHEPRWNRRRRIGESHGAGIALRAAAGHVAHRARCACGATRCGPGCRPWASSSPWRRSSP